MVVVDEPGIGGAEVLDRLLGPGSPAQDAAVLARMIAVDAAVPVADEVRGKIQDGLDRGGEAL